MRRISIALAIKNSDGATIVSVYETLIVSEEASGAVSVLSEERRKENEKKGVGSCEENAVFDWLGKNYIV